MVVVCHPRDQQPRRLGPFDERPYVVIQVETSAAIADIDAIAGVDGVDALYIGPADLGLGLGGAPAPDVVDVFDGTHPNASVLRTAFDAVVAAGRRHDVVPGLHWGNGASAAPAVAAARAATLLNTPKLRIWTDRLTGGLLIGAGLGLALARRG